MVDDQQWITDDERCVFIDKSFRGLIKGVRQIDVHGIIKGGNLI
jgi:hypothetical protein